MYVFDIVDASFDIESVWERDKDLLFRFEVFGSFDGSFAFFELIQGESELVHALDQSVDLSFEALPELLKLLGTELLKIDFGCHEFVINEGLNLKIIKLRKDSTLHKIERLNSS